MSVSSASSSSSESKLDIPCAKSIESKLNEQIEQQQKVVLEEAIKELQQKQLEEITLELQAPLCRTFYDQLINKGYTVTQYNYLKLCSSEQNQNKYKTCYKLKISVTHDDFMTHLPLPSPFHFPLTGFGRSLMWF